MREKLTLLFEVAFVTAMFVLAFAAILLCVLLFVLITS